MLGLLHPADEPWSQRGYIWRDLNRRNSEMLSSHDPRSCSSFLSVIQNVKALLICYEDGVLVLLLVIWPVRSVSQEECRPSDLNPDGTLNDDLSHVITVVCVCVCKVGVSVFRLFVHHQHPSWCHRYSDHRETQDWEHPGWEPTTSLRSIHWVVHYQPEVPMYLITVLCCYMWVGTQFGTSLSQ